MKIGRVRERGCAIAFAAWAACSHSAPTPPTLATPPAGDAAPSCAHMAEHLIGTLQSAKAAPQDQVDVAVGVITSRCEGDHWSAEARACFATASGVEDASNRCGAMLTQAQRDAIDQQTTQTFPTPAAPGAPAEAVGGGAAAPASGSSPPPPPPVVAPRRAASPKGHAPDGPDPCDGGK